MSVTLPFKSIEWRRDHVRILDQTALPAEEVYRSLRTVEEVAEAIESMRVRGAPLIGVSAAYGVALGALQVPPPAGPESLGPVFERLARTRPTAVSLFWALKRMREATSRVEEAEDWRGFVVQEAQAIEAEDRAICVALGERGAELLGEGATVLTYCNTGALATAGLGTALAAIYTAHGKGRSLSVIVPETRPVLQGSRLTAWELARAGVEAIVVSDNAVASLMRNGEIALCLVGADRIARNGDVANKIGTYGLAVLAGAHEVPFHVAAPLSTVDVELASGEAIPIEERPQEEVLRWGGVQMAPASIRARNPAFDITPARLVRSIVTERGALRPGELGPILEQEREGKAYRV